MDIVEAGHSRGGVVHLKKKIGYFVQCLLRQWELDMSFLLFVL